MKRLLVLAAATAAEGLVAPALLAHPRRGRIVDLDIEAVVAGAFALLAQLLHLDHVAALLLLARLQHFVLNLLPKLLVRTLLWLLQI